MKRRLVSYLFCLIVTSKIVAITSLGETDMDVFYGNDSIFQLLYSIPIEGASMAIDNLQNLYVGTQQGQVLQFDKFGHKKFEYNNNRLGTIGKIDVRNPLTILVYYPDFAVITLLDRTLSEIKQINLWDLDILEPKGIALANDNNIWIFDVVTAILKKTNQEGQTLFQSRNLNQLTQESLNPSFLQELDNLIYLSDEEKGIFIFDNFGQLVTSIPHKGIQQFQVFNEQLVFLENQTLFVLNLNDGNSKNILLPEREDDFFLLKIEQNRMYIMEQKMIRVYQIINS